MLPLLPIGAAVLLALLLYQFVIYPTFLSPLSKIPNAHFTAPITSLWIRYLRRNGQIGTRQLLAAHNRHGPIVRISPNELSVASLDGLRQIYTNGMEKAPWYAEEFQNYQTPNLVSMLHNKPHGVQKRMMSGVYSKSYVQNSEDLKRLCWEIVFERFFPVIGEAARKGLDFDAYGMNKALGSDLMSAFLWGTGSATDFIRNIPERNKFMENLKRKFRHLPGHEKATQELEDYILTLCQSAEDPSKQSSENSPSTKPIVYSALASRLSESKEPSPLTTSSPMVIAASEMFDQMAAAIETSRVSLTYLQWELSRRPDLQAALRNELRTLSPPISPNPRDCEPTLLPDPKMLDRLPLLNAILKETLRIYTPSPPLLSRVTPRTGAVIDGYTIPAGVVLGTSGHCMHRNPTVFPNPEKFKPERWLEDGDMAEMAIDRRSVGNEMNRWFWAFGSGGRMCIGSHYSVLSTLPFRFFFQFPFLFPLPLPRFSFVARSCGVASGAGRSQLPGSRSLLFLLLVVSATIPHTY